MFFHFKKCIIGINKRGSSILCYGCMICFSTKERGDVNSIWKVFFIIFFFMALTSNKYLRKLLINIFLMII